MQPPEFQKFSTEKIEGRELSEALNKNTSQDRI